jgi:4-hydroxy-3-methylbut-2-enyl diphosphate reductase IspH
MGIKKIDFDGNVENFFALNKGKIGSIIIRAHGIGPEFYDCARKNSVDIIDATCPKVIKVQRLAKLYADKGYQVIIIGEKNH